MPIPMPSTPYPRVRRLPHFPAIHPHMVSMISMATLRSMCRKPAAPIPPASSGKASDLPIATTDSGMASEQVAYAVKQAYDAKSYLPRLRFLDIGGRRKVGVVKLKIPVFPGGAIL